MMNAEEPSIQVKGGLERFINQILQGDCRELLPQLPDECVDLIVTSPPYADQRKHVYGGVHPDEYVEWIGREWAYPTNVLHMATECYNRNHAATFPVDLPSWFIKLFTGPGDVVLDPFIGSGTTAVACVRLGRRYIGFEWNPEYVQVARERLEKESRQPNLYTFSPLFFLSNSLARTEP
jgi:DNA modification methylase